ncbi:hypothetical protein PR048_021586 [Dryococelus australis]|uniref:AH domain-containing protein n=1 Tax=Dryococelus australis TaxID=614101 RepID=A0ABQ9GYS9_9NEOP|nr:hypothetical protein PR048_021586 [Dryococelus australis]
MWVQERSSAVQYSVNPYGQHENSELTVKSLIRTSDGYSGMAYDRWIEQHASEASTKSAMAKMQHQYWVTKQTVFRKLGKKDDACIVASDAELDAKLELFRSVQNSCLDLQRIIDKYQERLCSLAQEENSMGRFLKEAGKNDKTRAGKMMTAVGKSLSYSGQQRLALRVPLMRLYQEVETFRHRAIADTLQNVNAMEKVRTEYRASLNWMKNVSQELDPDTYKQLERFRKVQTEVRCSKLRFDQLKLDCLQKVDLLAAARCNMFSHALILYQNMLLQFAEKATRPMTLNELVDRVREAEQILTVQASLEKPVTTKAPEVRAPPEAPPKGVPTTTPCMVFVPKCWFCLENHWNKDCHRKSEGAAVPPNRVDKTLSNMPRPAGKPTSGTKLGNADARETPSQTPLTSTGYQHYEFSVVTELTETSLKLADQTSSGVTQDEDKDNVATNSTRNVLCSILKASSHVTVSQWTDTVDSSSKITPRLRIKTGNTVPTKYK